MTLRTDGNIMTHGFMAGVRQSGDDLGGLIKEIHGMYDRHLADLQRLPGKLLNSIATTSTVWTIAQLRFRDRNVLVEHTDASLDAHSDLGPLPGMIFELPKAPQVVPADWPASNLELQDAGLDTLGETEGSSRPLPPGTHRRKSERGAASILATPDLHELICPGWSDIYYSVISHTWTARVPWGGMLLLRVSLDPYPAWLDWGVGPSAAVMQHRTNHGVHCFGHWEWTSGIFSTHKIGFLINDLDSVPAGDTSIQVTLRAVNLLDDVLLNPNGSEVSEVIDLTVTKMTFTVEAPASIDRDVAFDLVITCSESDYTPSGDVTIALTSSDGSDSISPTTTDNTGWTNGAKTVSCTITGGEGADTFTITVTDSNCKVTGSDSGDIHSEVPNDCPEVPASEKVEMEIVSLTGVIWYHDADMGSWPGHELPPPGSKDWTYLIPSNFPFSLPYTSDCIWENYPRTLELIDNSYWKLSFGSGGGWDYRLLFEARKYSGNSPVGTYTVVESSRGYPFGADYGISHTVNNIVIAKA